MMLQDIKNDIENAYLAWSHKHWSQAHFYITCAIEKIKSVPGLRQQFEEYFRCRNT